MERGTVNRISVVARSKYDGEKREARLRSARLIPRKVEEAHTDTAIIVGRQVRALLKRVKGKLRARFDRETRFLSNRVVRNTRKILLACFFPQILFISNRNGRVSKSESRIPFSNEATYPSLFDSETVLKKCSIS